MKYSYTLVFLCLCLHISAQQLYNRTEKAGEYSNQYIVNIPFAPPAGKDGFIGNMNIVFAFRNCFGELVVDYYQKDNATITYYQVGTKKYALAEIPSKYLPEEIDGLTFSADVFNQSVKLGRVSFNGAFIGHGVDAGCFGNGIKSLGNLGISYKDYRDGWWQRLMLKAFEFDQSDYKMSWDISNYFSEKNRFDDLLVSAEQEEGLGNLEKALSLYQKANTLRPDIPSLELKISQLEGQIDNRNRHITNARATWDLEKSLEEYKLAHAADPNNDYLKKIIKELEERIRSAEEREKELELEEQKKQKEQSLKKYNEEKQQEVSQQNNIEQEAFTSYATAITAGAFLTFQNLNNDSRNNIYNERGTNWKFNYGFGISNIPILVEEDSRSFDGVNYDYYSALTDGALVTIDMYIGGEYWPLRSKNFDLGFKLGTQFGLSPSADALLGASLGSEINVGFRSIKFVGAIESGYLFGTYHDEIFGADDFLGYSTNIVKDGGINGYYLKGETGVKFLFDAWSSRAYIEILYNWFNPISEYQFIGEGGSVAFAASNRLKIKATWNWQFPRLFAYHPSYYDYDGRTDHNYDGEYFTIQLIRTLDFYKNNKK